MIDFLFLLSALFSEIAGTISWFGSSSILLPIAHQFFDYKNAIILIAIYHIFWNTSRLVLTYKHLDKKIFLLFGLPSVIATILGASLVESIDPNYLKLALGILLSIFALYLLWEPQFHIEPTPLFGRVGWFLSWFTAGIIWTGGVLRWAFMTLFGLSKERYIATIASIAILVDVTRIPIYFWQGFLAGEYLIYIPLLLFIAFIGSFIGRMIVKRLSSQLLRKIILITIILMGIHLWLQWYYGLYFL